VREEEDGGFIFDSIHEVLRYPPFCLRETVVVTVVVEQPLRTEEHFKRFKKTVQKKKIYIYILYLSSTLTMRLAVHGCIHLYPSACIPQLLFFFSIPHFIPRTTTKIVIIIFKKTMLFYQYV